MCILSYFRFIFEGNAHFLFVLGLVLSGLLLLNFLNYVGAYIEGESSARVDAL